MTVMDLMAIKQLVGSSLLVGFEGHEAPSELLERLARGEVGGVILFGRNIASPEQVATLTASVTRACAGGLPPIIAVDQEGGRVQRLRAPLVHWPPMREVAARGEVALTHTVGRAIGDDLRLLGFNLDFAPVLDVVTSDINRVIGDRSFGAEADVVVAHGLAFAHGLREAGIFACGKHFPGHGGPVDDSHLTLPTDARPERDMRASDLRPFAAAAAAELPMLMAAHVVYPCWDAGPATFSARLCTALLREELGFRGVLCSDDMEMGAIVDYGAIDEAALQALRAGIDLLLLCHRRDRQEAVFEALVRTAEHSAADRQRLEQAAARVTRLREAIGRSAPVEACGVRALADPMRHHALRARLNLP